MNKANEYFKIKEPSSMGEAQLQARLIRALANSSPAIYHDELALADIRGALRVLLNVGDKKVQDDIKAGITKYYADKEKYNKIGYFYLFVVIDPNGESETKKRVGFICTPKTMESFSEAFRTKEARGGI